MSDSKNKQQETPPIKALPPQPIEWADDYENPNNARVRRRLEADKRDLMRRYDNTDAISTKRIGDPRNEGDLANGGMGGLTGAETIISERGVVSDAAEHAIADAYAGATEHARKQVINSAGFGKPVGEAQAAESDLLGDDAPPAGTAGVAGNPQTAGRKAPPPPPGALRPPAAGADATQGNGGAAGQSTDGAKPAGTDEASQQGSAK